MSGEELGAKIMANVDFTALVLRNVAKIAEDAPLGPRVVYDVMRTAPGQFVLSNGCHKERYTKDELVWLIRVGCYEVVDKRQSYGTSNTVNNYSIGWQNGSNPPSGSSGSTTAIQTLKNKTKTIKQSKNMNGI